MKKSNAKKTQNVFTRSLIPKQQHTETGEDIIALYIYTGINVINETVILFPSIVRDISTID